LAAFGLRASRLPRRCALDIFLSCRRRPAPQFREMRGSTPAASVARAEERDRRPTPRLTQNNRARSTRIFHPRPRAPTCQQYIDSNHGETISTRRPRLRRRAPFRGDLCEQNSLAI
jgi:hypothetical protein